MDSELVVTTAATPLTLLTDALRRQAVGLSDSDTSQDTALAALDLRVSAAIAAECCIAIGNGGQPTLLRETLTETFRFVECDEIILSRRHNIEITSITADGATIGAEDYFADAETGIVRRFCNGRPWLWCACKLIVVYQAGFAANSIPGDLTQAAMEFMRLSWSNRDRDPSLKSERTEIVGVEVVERGYWIGSVPGQANSSAVPDIVAGQLQRYRNTVVA